MMFHSPPTKKKRQEESMFDRICRLARAKDLNGLESAKKEDYHFLNLEKLDGCTPMRHLAREGDKEVIEFLTENYKYHYRSEDVIQGYAEAGMVQDVHRMIKAGEWRVSYELDDYQKKHAADKTTGKKINHDYVPKSWRGAASG